jgi:hypothetical protein
MIKDTSYLLFLWLMVPHKQIIAKCYVLKALYNRQLSYVKVVVEFFFDILKKIFWGLRIKSNLNLFFSLNVIVFYYILHVMHYHIDAYNYCCYHTYNT